MDTGNNIAHETRETREKCEKCYQSGTQEIRLAADWKSSPSGFPDFQMRLYRFRVFRVFRGQSLNPRNPRQSVA